MKIAIFPGSFNPWHQGHEDVLKKSLQVFDKVILVQMQNPDKKEDKVLFPNHLIENYGTKIALSFHHRLLKDNLEAIQLFSDENTIYFSSKLELL